jgi:DNA-directed RNA polymerase subunit RPC12/RpoP
MNNFSSGRGDLNNQSGMIIDSQSTSTIYVCGSNFLYIKIGCGNDNELKPRENILCKECNGRIFYKKRTRKAVQFEAR